MRKITALCHLWTRRWDSHLLSLSHTHTYIPIHLLHTHTLKFPYTPLHSPTHTHTHTRTLTHALTHALLCPAGMAALLILFPAHHAHTRAAFPSSPLAQ